MPNGDKLESWKEIAAFLEKDERTAMRWAQERGLPVHRVPGGKRGRVFASKDEITRWLAGQPETHAEATSPPAGPRLKLSVFRRHWLAAGAAAAVLVTALALAIFSHAMRPRQLSRISFTDNAVQAWDSEGHRLWAYTFAQRFDVHREHVTTLEELSRVVDLRGDGHKEVLIVAPFQADLNNQDTSRYEVDCFSSRGKLLWSYAPEAKFQFGQHDLQGLWAVFDLFVSAHDGKSSIWVTSGHQLWGNSFVVQLDAQTGNATTRFVNTGVIYKLNELKTPRGSYLLAAGFNNEYEAGILAVIDENQPFAASPQTAGTRHKCDSCPTGDPFAYLVFPRSEINELRAIYEDPVRNIIVSGETIEVRKYELRQEANVSTFYQFRADAGFQPVSLRYDSSYDMLHRQLSSEHKLNHSLADCPERLHPKPVRLWTPSSGWTELKFPPAKASD